MSNERKFDGLDEDGERGVALGGAASLKADNGSCDTCERFEDFQDIGQGEFGVVYCCFGSHGKMHLTMLSSPACGEFVKKEGEEHVINVVAPVGEATAAVEEEIDLDAYFNGVVGNA